MPSLSDLNREDLVYGAQMAEKAERYEDMVDWVKRLVQNVSAAELTADERNLLSVAYKNITGARRASWRILSGIESREQAKNENSSVKKLNQTKKLRLEVENEMKNICNEIVHLVDKILLPLASSGETKVFYHKMRGDYYRYLAEFNSLDNRKEITEGALQAYKQASEIATSELPPTHATRLGLALNFSVFYYEIMNNADRACRLAKTAFDDAIAELDNLTEESYKDSTLIMQLLRDNLTLWSADVSDEKEINGMQDVDN